VTEGTSQKGAKKKKVDRWSTGNDFTLWTRRGLGWGIRKRRKMGGEERSITKHNNGGGGLEEKEKTLCAILGGNPISGTKKGPQKFNGTGCELGGGPKQDLEGTIGNRDSTQRKKSKGTGVPEEG